MFCSKCGNQLPEGSRFCNGCGSAVALTEESGGQNMTRQYQQIPNRTVSVNVGEIKARTKTAYRKIAGEHIQAEDAHEYERYPHPYHQLGGWLGFIAYAQLVAVGLLALLSVISIFSIIQLARYIGGLGVWLAIVQVIEIAGFGLTAFFGIKFFQMIKTKNPRFLRFYELLMLSLAGIYVATLILTGFRAVGETIGNVIGAGIAFAIWTTYFRKSVRVRTYMGSDAYLKYSIFWRNAVAPVPADTQPYAPPGSYTPPAPTETGNGFCSKCGAPFVKDEAFCTACGEKRIETKTEQGTPEPISASVSKLSLEPDISTHEPIAQASKYCSQCGKQLVSAGQFCEGCGQKQ